MINHTALGRSLALGILILFSNQLGAQVQRARGTDPLMAARSGSTITDGAGQRKQRPGRRFGRRQRSNPKAMKRQKERLTMVMIWKLTEHLDLSEQQADKLIPRLRIQQKEMEGLAAKRQELYREFNAKIEDEKVSQKDTDRFMNELKRLEQSRLDLRLKHVKNVADILDGIQLAKYVVFEHHFKERLRSQMTAPRQHRPDARY